MHKNHHLLTAVILNHLLRRISRLETNTIIRKIPYQLEFAGHIMPFLDVFAVIMISEAVIKEQPLILRNVQRHVVLRAENFLNSPLAHQLITSPLGSSSYT